MVEVTPCALYAAKSTEDRHGSIPDQLHDCRVAIEDAGSRHIHAGYTDEAVSAFSSNRGQGLVDAGTSSYGETRTRTGDTTIFRDARSLASYGKVPANPRIPTRQR
jgi:hypothetical protein